MKGLFWIVTLVIFLLDRLTKWWVVSFNVPHTLNTGAAFGLLEDQRLLLIIITIVVIGVLFYEYKRLRQHTATTVFGGMILGGALGNLYDRIVYGSVVDFLDFFAGSYHWPAFNVADSCICVGAVLVAVIHWKEKLHVKVKP